MQIVLTAMPNCQQCTNVYTVHYTLKSSHYGTDLVQTRYKGLRNIQHPSTSKVVEIELICTEILFNGHRNNPREYTQILSL
jgi:hypothetical protein